MNPIESTTGKSCGHDLRPSENRPGLLADLRAFSPGPPRVAAVSHQLLGQALEHSPVDECLDPAWSTRQISAPLFGEALEIPSVPATMAFGGERADLLDSVVNSLFSDNYEAYDPEDPNILALMADYEAAFLDTGAPSFDKALEAPSVQAIMASGGEREKQPAGLSDDPDLARGKKSAHGGNLPLTSEQRQALSHIFKTDPKRTNQSIADEIGLSYSTIYVLRKKFSKTGDLKPGDRANRLTVDQRRAILHIFETDPKKSNQSIIDEMDVSLSTIKALRRKFRKTGNLKPGDSAKRLTIDQRRAISHIFKTDPERSSQSIADEFGVSLKTIQAIKRQFSKTGTIKPGTSANRLTADRRRAILHIFETDPERSNRSIADELGVGLRTIQTTRNQFRKTGNIQPGDSTNRLTGDQRRAILHSFEMDPERSNQSLVDEFGVSYSTIQVLRKRFYKTGNIQPKDNTNRLTGDQRQALLHIFKTDPQRRDRSLVDEFGMASSTIYTLRRQFSKTGNLKPGDPSNRLTGDQRRALSHIFETDPGKNNQSLADEFGVNLSTMKRLRERFRKTGNLEPGQTTNRLTADQRQAILHIFETDPGKNNQSIADEFDVNISTIRRLRERLAKTGNIEPRDHPQHLTADQRRAILHIFETDPKKSNRSIADEFGVAYLTIYKLRRKFGKT